MMEALAGILGGSAAGGSAASAVGTASALSGLAQGSGGKVGKGIGKGPMPLGPEPSATPMPGQSSASQSFRQAQTTAQLIDELMKASKSPASTYFHGGP